MKILSYYKGCCTYIRLSLIKFFRRKVNFSFDFRTTIGNQVVLLFDDYSSVVFGKNTGIRDNVYIAVRKNGYLRLGNGVFFNNGCQITVHDFVSIGDNVKIGQYTCFYDHDHDYKASDGVKEGLYKTSPVIVGDDTWIGAGCIILRGSQIGKNCVIGAGCVVNGIIPDNTLLVQKKQQCEYNIKKMNEE